MPMYNPPHPGEVIREYLGDVSVSEAARHLGVGRVTFSRVLNGKAAVSPEMAVRLAAAFGTSSPEVWLRLQAKYDIWQVQTRSKIRVGRDLVGSARHVWVPFLGGPPVYGYLDDDWFRGHWISRNGQAVDTCRRCAVRVRDHHVVGTRRHTEAD